MSSTEFNIGLTGAKNSSRVLKPPGGGHSDIFGAPENKSIQPRPKYDQQNSSNLNFCMNTTDPNVLVEQTKKQLDDQQQKQQSVTGGGGGGGNQQQRSENNITGGDTAAPAQQKGRVPPGGFSQGLW